MEQFFTREKANEGIKLPLFDPKTDDPTEHYLIVHSVDSDAFQEADQYAKRDLMRVASIESEEERKQELEKSTLLVIASLIKSWSFDIPCNNESKIKLLTEAPQIRKEIDRVAVNRKAFFTERLENSTGSQKTTSTSKKSPKVQKSRSKQA